MEIQIWQTKGIDVETVSHSVQFIIMLKWESVTEISDCLPSFYLQIDIVSCLFSQKSVLEILVNNSFIKIKKERKEKTETDSYINWMTKEKNVHINFYDIKNITGTCFCISLNNTHKRIISKEIKQTRTILLIMVR